MPKELVTYANTQGCSQISDFFNRDAMVLPPYVYGYLPGDQEDSAIFWCKNVKQSDKPYWLMVFSRTNPSTENACPQKIEWWNYPGGLSIDNNIHVPLKLFSYVDDPKKKVSGVETTASNTVVSYYDGVSTLFYCHDHKWVYFVRD